MNLLCLSNFYIIIHVCCDFLFSVPLEPELRAKWRSQICKHQEFDEIPGAYPVCMLHFDQSKIKHQGKRTTLVKGTLPTVFPG